MEIFQMGIGGLAGSKTSVERELGRRLRVPRRAQVWSTVLRELIRQCVLHLRINAAGKVLLNPSDYEVNLTSKKIPTMPTFSFPSHHCLIL